MLSSSKFFAASRFRRLLSFVLLVGVTCLASGQTFGNYTDFYDFKPTTTGTNGQSVTNGGSSPSVQQFAYDSKGDLFGTFGPGSGAYSQGMLFELTPSGVYKDLHDFGGPITSATGQQITDLKGRCYLSIDAQGNIFGAGGDGQNHDMLWEFTSGGTYKDLHDFYGETNSPDGAGPDGNGIYANLLIDPAGDIYGTCAYGGGNAAGTIWEYSAAGEFQIIHHCGNAVTFSDGSTGNDGEAPGGNIVFDAEGNICGMCFQGGPTSSSNPSGPGAVWKITRDTYQVLHYFGGAVAFTNGTSGPEGRANSGVFIDASGNLYGMAQGGPYLIDPANPSEGGYGFIWKLAPDGTYTDLHDFGGTVTGTNGKSKLDAGFEVTAVDPTGGVYGIGFQSADASTPLNNFIFELSSTGKYVDLHDFGGTVTLTNGKTGPDPSTTSYVTIDPNGNLFGSSYPVTWRLPISVKLKQLSISPSSLVGGNTATGTVTLASSVSTIDEVVDITSASSAAQPQASVTIPAGQTTVTFPIPTAAVKTTTSAMLTGKLDGVTLTGSLTVQAPTIKGFSVSPSSVIGGSSSVGTVTLNGTAPAGGIVVNLSSGSANVSVPATVTVAPKASSGTFTIKTTPVAGDTSVSLKASTGSVSLSSTLLVRTPLVSSISLSPTSVFGGANVSGVVALGSAAPTGGISVTLSSNSSAAVCPAKVSIPAGGTQATFTVQTKAVATTVSVVVEAQLGSSSRTTGLIVKCPVVKALALSPASLVGGTSSAGTVTLGSEAPSGGLTVSLASSSSYAQVPSSVVVAAGSTTGAFTVKTNAIASSIVVTISAKNGSSSASSSLAINAPTLLSISLNPTSVVGGSSSTGTVTLSGAAASGGVVISLSSASSAGSVPSSVTIPAGSTSASFTIKTIAVPSNVSDSITAKLGNVSKSASLTIQD